MRFPNFATIVTNDDYDEGPNLSRPGMFRRNIGVDGVTFDRLVSQEPKPDYAAVDRFHRTASNLSAHGRYGGDLSGRRRIYI
jgi:hypothetical protein